jgi:cell division septum initiation protein DivIVA
MLGVEMMLSNMIGMKPDELKAAVNQVIAAVNAGLENIKQVNQRLASIDERLANLEKEQMAKDYFNGSGNLPARSGERIQL